MINDGIITAPVSIGDLQTEFGLASVNDLGTLITRATINPFARYKPVCYPSVTALTEEQLSEIHYGLTPVANDVAKKVLTEEATYGSDGYTWDDILAANIRWTYKKPTGGMNEPFRMSDFVSPKDYEIERLTGPDKYGYNAGEQGPVASFGAFYIKLSTLKSLVTAKTKATTAAGSDSKKDPLNYYITNEQGIPYSNFETTLSPVDAIGSMLSRKQLPLSLMELVGSGEGNWWRFGLLIDCFGALFLAVSKYTTYEAVKQAKSSYTTLSSKMYMNIDLISNPELIESLYLVANDKTSDINREIDFNALPVLVKDIKLSEKGPVIDKNTMIYSMPVYFGKAAASLKAIKIAVRNDVVSDDIYLHLTAYTKKINGRVGIYLKYDGQIPTIGIVDWKVTYNYSDKESENGRNPYIQTEKGTFKTFLQEAFDNLLVTHLSAVILTVDFKYKALSDLST